MNRPHLRVVEELGVGMIKRRREGFGDLADHLGHGGAGLALVGLGGGFDGDDDGAAEVVGLGRGLLLSRLMASVRAGSTWSASSATELPYFTPWAPW
ncbi:hypothetical protein [Nonomuraea dietziae]|uniref:hypothetical protein n=1 Tax=Nonomuraea dietziae TaxID=65515 RepID=UPI0031DC735F